MKHALEVVDEIRGSKGDCVNGGSEIECSGDLGVAFLLVEEGNDKRVEEDGGDSNRVGGSHGVDDIDAGARMDEFELWM